MSDSPLPGGDVLAVCGLAFEARIAAGDGVRTLSGGGRSAVLAGAIEAAVHDGVVGIVSFGVAGGLVDGLSPGSLVVADAIVGPDERFPTHVAWSRMLESRLPACARESIAGVDQVVVDAAAKAALARRTGAIAVDMESHIAARIARDHGLPFIALRAIADPLRRSLPPAALVAMREDGGVDLRALLKAIGRRPQQLPMLLRIGLDTRLASNALRQGRGLLGSRLGYADLDQLPVDVI